MDISKLLNQLGLEQNSVTKGELTVNTPIDGSEIGKVKCNNAAEVEAMISKSHAAFLKWRQVPAPKRGEVIRLFAEKLRAHKEDLGKLVTIECGKIYQEGLGEVQEMIDICDFAVGLSRQLYGLTIASERPEHHMRETWHPLGVIGVISAFNFPVAVWAWNFALAIVCGNAVIWKPSEKVPLTALACLQLFEDTVRELDYVPQGLAQVAIGKADVGEVLVDSHTVRLVSATGSCRMGKIVGAKVAQRLGKAILELGGNNAMIITPSADLEMAVHSIIFSAVGTTGQRCTSLRRIIVHSSIYAEVLQKLKKAYQQLPIGDPLDEKNLVGPLIDEDSYDMMQKTLAIAQDVGASCFGGERVDMGNGGYYVKPAIVEMAKQEEIVRTETFAPVLYALKYETFEEALSIHNDVPQGLSSSIFTNDVREAEKFLSDCGSDCGIANVNIGPSGAEIGGAFGGEKETGGGRESGSDAWKGYMRRATNTINYSHELPLAQGIKFEV
jgi:aldehyde dehydrogenase (NAD+)